MLDYRAKDSQRRVARWGSRCCNMAQVQIDKQAVGAAVWHECSSVGRWATTMCSGCTGGAIVQHKCRWGVSAAEWCEEVRALARYKFNQANRGGVLKCKCSQVGLSYGVQTRRCTMEYEISGIPYSVMWILRRKSRGSRSDLQECSATFLASFPIDFHSHGDHVTVASFVARAGCQPLKSCVCHGAATVKLQGLIVSTTNSAPLNLWTVIELMVGTLGLPIPSIYNHGLFLAYLDW